MSLSLYAGSRLTLTLQGKDSNGLARRARCAASRGLRKTIPSTGRWSALTAPSRSTRAVRASRTLLMSVVS